MSKKSKKQPDILKGELPPLIYEGDAVKIMPLTDFSKKKQYAIYGNIKLKKKELLMLIQSKQCISKDNYYFISGLDAMAFNLANEYKLRNKIAIKLAKVDKAISSILSDHKSEFNAVSYPLCLYFNYNKVSYVMNRLNAKMNAKDVDFTHGAAYARDSAKSSVTITPKRLIQIMSGYDLDTSIEPWFSTVEK